MRRLGLELVALTVSPGSRQSRKAARRGSVPLVADLFHSHGSWRVGGAGRHLVEEAGSLRGQQVQHISWDTGIKKLKWQYLLQVMYLRGEMASVAQERDGGGETAGMKDRVGSQG